MTTLSTTARKRRVADCPPVLPPAMRSRLVEAARQCVRACLVRRYDTYDDVARAIGYRDGSTLRHLMGERGQLPGGVHLTLLNLRGQECGCYALVQAQLAPGLTVAAVTGRLDGSLDDERADSLVALGRITEHEKTDPAAALQAAVQLTAVAARAVSELQARL